MTDTCYFNELKLSYNPQEKLSSCGYRKNSILSNFKTVDDYLTRIKTLEEQIDVTKIKLEGDKRTLLVLSMTLPVQYRSMVQLWTVMEGITAKKAMEMLREEVRHQEDDKTMTIARHTSPVEKTGECWHCHKKGHNKEDCWLLHPEKKKERQKEKQTSDIQQDVGY
jgi:hypothetical protein